LFGLFGFSDRLVRCIRCHNPEGHQRLIVGSKRGELISGYGAEMSGL